MGSVQFIVSLLPAFGVIFSLLLLVLLGVAGVWLPFFKQKISWQEIGLSAYFSLTIFTIWCYLSWYLMPWQMSIMVLLVPMVVAAARGWWRVRRRLDLHWSPLSVGLMILTAGLAFALYKLTYENGLHDEYFHHAVLALFRANGQYPFLNPYQIGLTLNHSYHVGTYFTAITTQWLGGLSSESALDVTKLLFFLPFPMVFGLSLKKLFPATHWSALLSLVAASLLSGPFLVFQDSFSLWLFQHAELPQVYMPVMYDLAGITWTGLLVSIIIVTFAWLMIGKKISVSISMGTGAILIGLMGLALLNTAFFLTALAMILALGVAVGIQEQFWLKLTRRQWWLVGIGMMSILVAVWVSPVGVLLSAYLGHGGLLRSIHQWGFAFASSVIEGGIQVEHRYLGLLDVRFWRAFGVLPLVGLGILVWRGRDYLRLSNNQRYLWWLSMATLLVFPLMVAIIADQGLGLALNKLLRPGVMVLPLVFFLLPDTGGIRHLRWLWLGLIGLSLVSPSYYLFVNNGSGLQQFWKNLTPDDQAAVEFLQQRGITQLKATSWRSTYLLANNVPGQVQICQGCSQSMSGLLIFDKHGDYHLPTEAIDARELLYDNNSYSIFSR